jgi:transposase
MGNMSEHPAARTVFAPYDSGHHGLRMGTSPDNLSMRRALDVLLFALAHPRWAFVFQPKYAAYLNLIEPWWKTLRSLALAGRFFETWEQIEEAIEKAKDYWNAHRHPYVWGRRRRHRAARRPGIGAIPAVGG